MVFLWFPSNLQLLCISPTSRRAVDLSSPAHADANSAASSAQSAKLGFIAFMSFTTRSQVGADSADGADAARRFSDTKCWFKANINCTFVSLECTSWDWFPALLRNSGNSVHAAANSRRKTVHGIPSAIGFSHDGQSVNTLLMSILPSSLHNSSCSPAPPPFYDVN